MGDLYPDDKLKNKMNWKVMSLLNKVKVLHKLDRGMRVLPSDAIMYESKISFFKNLKKRTGEALQPVFS
jgi:hypothetical protein